MKNLEQVPKEGHNSLGTKKSIEYKRLNLERTERLPQTRNKLARCKDLVYKKNRKRNGAYSSVLSAVWCGSERRLKGKKFKLGV
jgi:hypothetical protein